METNPSGNQIRMAVPLLAVFLSMFTADASGHCDTMNGPVVEAARSALDAGDVRLALPRIEAADEPEVQSAFARAVRLRTQEMRLLLTL